MCKMKCHDGGHPTQPLASACIGTNVDAKREKGRKEKKNHGRAEFKVRLARSVKPYLLSQKNDQLAAQSYRAAFGFRTSVRQQRQSRLL